MGRLWGLLLIGASLLTSPARGVGQIKITGFVGEEKELVEQAVEWAWRSMLSERVEECTYRHSPVELWSAAVPKLYKRPPEVGQLFKGQLRVLRDLARSNRFPDIKLYPYHEENFSYGMGALDTVRVYKNYAVGAFDVQLNQFNLNKNSDIASWGSVIAHEMVHNLGHIHPNPTDEGLEIAYDSRYLINRYQSCVYVDGYDSQAE